MGYLGFLRYGTAGGEVRSPLDLLYLTAQLFTLESGAVKPPVPWQLELARVLAPLATATALLAAMARIFADRVEMLRLARYRWHVVVCGLGRKGYQLVKEFRAVRWRVVAIESDEENNWTEACRDLGAIVLVADATDASVLAKARVVRAGHVIAVCGDDGANIEIAVRCHQLAGQARTHWQNRVKRFLPRPWRRAGPNVRCHVQIVDLQLSDLFRRHAVCNNLDPHFSAEILNIYENSSRLALMDHPLDGEGIPWNDNRAVHLVIVGFGRMGQSLALQAARMGHYANGKRLRLTAIDRDATKRNRVFTNRYPQFGQVCDFEVIEGESDDPELQGQIVDLADAPETLTTLAVCLDDDSEALMCALDILHKLSGLPTQFLVRMTDEAGLASLLEGAVDGSGQPVNVNTFDASESVVTLEMLLKHELDRLAQSIHDDFRENRRKEGRPETDKSMQPWDTLCSDFRDSNRQQADHIPVKLRAIGCRTERSGSSEPNGRSTFRFSGEADEVEILARMEHARWCAERLLAGWTYGPAPKNVAKKTHPDLVDWEDLSDQIKEYDREFVRLIPDLLESVDQRIVRCRPTS